MAAGTRGGGKERVGPGLMYVVVFIGEKTLPETCLVPGASPGTHPHPHTPATTYESRVETRER